MYTYIWTWCVVLLAPSKIYKSEEGCLVLPNKKTIKYDDIQEIESYSYKSKGVNYGFGVVKLKTANHNYCWFDMKDCDMVKKRIEHAIEVSKLSE